MKTSNLFKAVTKGYKVACTPFGDLVIMRGFLPVSTKVLCHEQDEQRAYNFIIDMYELQSNV